MLEQERAQSSVHAHLQSVGLDLKFPGRNWLATRDRWLFTTKNFRGHSLTVRHRQLQDATDLMVEGIDCVMILSLHLKSKLR